MTLPVSKYEELLETVRNLKRQTIRVRELASPLLHTIITANNQTPGAVTGYLEGDFTEACPSWSQGGEEEPNFISGRTSIQRDVNLFPEGKSPETMDSLVLELSSKSSYSTSKMFDDTSEEYKSGAGAAGTTRSNAGVHMSVSSEPESGSSRNLAMLYHGTWPVERTMWNSEPPAHAQVAPPQSDMQSVMSFASSSGAAPLDKVLNGDGTRSASQQHLDVKVDMVYSLLSMLGTQECPDMGETLLALSSSPESSLAMRQAGCLPVLVQLVYSDKDKETREKAAKALHNLVQVQPEEKIKKREVKVLRLLEEIRLYCNHTIELDSKDLETIQHPAQVTENLIKLSFDEGYRQTICELGGIYALVNLVEVDHAIHADKSESEGCITLRRYAGMALTNLTFGHSQNKALLCSFREFMTCLVQQLSSNSDELRQVTASVLRNLSWRADASSRLILREVGSVPALMSAAMISQKESTLKSILSALWNLSAHCSMNKADICSVEGALGFLVDMLSYKPASKTLTIIENAGGILRNISSHIAVREDYRSILRKHNCLQVLLQQLKSPSLTVVSNACGTLWNLSAKCAEDQKMLWDMGAAPMLRSLNHSKHIMIATGSRAALKNLLSSRPSQNLFDHIDSTAKELGLTALPTLGARKQRALAKDLDQNLSETCDNIEPTSPPLRDTSFDPTKSTLQCRKFSFAKKDLSPSEPQSLKDSQLAESFSSLNLNESHVVRKSQFHQTSTFTSSFATQSRSSRSSTTYIQVRNKFSDCTFEDEQDNLEQPVDYSQKYSETKLHKVVPNTSSKEPTEKSDPNYLFRTKCPKQNVSQFTDFADVEQPTNYSLRYAENDSDSEDMCKNPGQTERFYGEQDTVKTYYTEGTPYETPYNFSTATSMSDLRIDPDTKPTQSNPPKASTSDVKPPQSSTTETTLIKNKTFDNFNLPQQKNKSFDIPSQKNNKFEGFDLQQQKHKYENFDLPQQANKFESFDLPQQRIKCENFDLSQQTKFENFDLPQQKTKFDNFDLPQQKTKFDNFDLPQQTSKFDDFDLPQQTSKFDNFDLPQQKTKYENFDLSEQSSKFEQNKFENFDLTQKSNKFELHSEKFELRSEKFPTEKEDVSTVDSSEKKSKSVFSSGVMTPEKPVNYCVEGTPRSFSRVSSFSSLNLEEPASSEKSVKGKDTDVCRVEKEPSYDETEPEQTVTSEEAKPDNKVERVEEANAAGKVVTFGRVVDYAEETPLMFSRCSSLGSLSSTEQHSIHDDRSSVVSDFSRMTSGIVSPSELPDSPTQTVPPSPRHRKPPLEFPAVSEPTTRPERQKSVFEDNVIKFKEVNTPVEFSTNTSLSSLTIDDEPNIASFALVQNALEQRQPNKNETSPTLGETMNKQINETEKNNCNGAVAAAELPPVSEGEEEGEDDMLAACINIGMQNNRHRQSKQISPKHRTGIPSSLPKYQMKSPLRSGIPMKYQPSKPQESRLPLSDSRLRPVEVNCDSTRTYCTEDTPAMLSQAGSHSDLSVLSISSKEKSTREQDDKPEFSDDSSNLSGDNDNILAECIQSAMPKARRQLVPPKIISKGKTISGMIPRSGAPEGGNNKNETVTSRVTEANLQQRIFKNVPFIGAKDEIENYAVEDSPCHFSLRSSLSDLTVDGSTTGHRRKEDRDSFDKPTSSQYRGDYAPYGNSSYLASTSRSTNKKSPETSPYGAETKFTPPKTEDGHPVLSRTDSLSSLSVESFGLMENAEQALLEQCISSGMPKSKNPCVKVPSSEPTKSVTPQPVRISNQNDDIAVAATATKPQQEPAQNSKNVYVASVVMSTKWTAEMPCPQPPKTTGVPIDTDETNIHIIGDENLLTHETKNGYDDVDKCSHLLKNDGSDVEKFTPLLLDGSVEDNTELNNTEPTDLNKSKVHNRMLDPDAMIESLDRFTAELVSQSSHLQSNRVDCKLDNMVTSGHECGDTWNEDTSPNDVSFPSISISAPMAASFKSETSHEDNKILDEINDSFDSKDVVDVGKTNSEEFASTSSNQFEENTQDVVKQRSSNSKNDVQDVDTIKDLDTPKDDLHTRDSTPLKQFDVTQDDQLEKSAESSSKQFVDENLKDFHESNFVLSKTHSVYSNGDELREEASSNYFDDMKRIGKFSFDATGKDAEQFSSNQFDLSGKDSGRFSSNQFDLSCKDSEQFSSNQFEGTGKDSDQFSSLSTLTDSTLIALEATKIANVVQCEVAMTGSGTSVTSCDLDRIKPPSMMESLISLTSSVSETKDANVKLTPTPSRKKSLPAGLMVRRALGNSTQTKSLENLADNISSVSSSCNLDHIKPPSVMGDYLDMIDMENSMISVSSITSEIADPIKTDFIPNGPVTKDLYDLNNKNSNSNWIFEPKQSNIMHLLSSNAQHNNSITDIENINPPSLLNEVTDLCNSTADIVTENAYSETDVYEDCFSQTYDQTLKNTDEITEYSDANSVTPIQSDFATSSAESTPKKVKNLNRLTPKQRRQLAKERFKTYTVAAEMVIREEYKAKMNNVEETSSSEVNFDNNNSSSNSSFNSPKLTPKERRQNDRARFQTRVIDGDLPPELLNGSFTPQETSPPQSKLELRKAMRQKRLENKERFRTRTLSSEEVSDVSPVPERRNITTEDLHIMLQHEANLVIDSLKQLRSDELLDCETLSLVSNEDESEHNSVSSVNYRTYHKSWSFCKNLPVVEVVPEPAKTIPEPVTQPTSQEVSDSTSETSDLDVEQAESNKVGGKPKIVKPDSEQLEDIAQELEPEVKAIRGRKKAYISPYRRQIPNMKPIKTMTSNLVKNVTSTIKSNSISKLNAAKQVKPVVTNTTKPSPSKLSKLQAPKSVPKPNLTKPEVQKLTSGLRKPSPVSAQTVQQEPPKLERQGTFTKEEKKSKIPESKIPMPASLGEKQKSTTSKIARAITGKTIPTATSKIQTKIKTETSKSTFYTRSPSADRDFGCKGKKTNMHGSSSSQSLQSAESAKMAIASKRSSIPNMNQRSNSNTSITSSDSNGKKKPVTSKIASLWKRNDDTKKQQPKKDENNVRLRQKNVTNNDNTSTKRLSRLGSFIQVDEIVVDAT